MKKVVFLSVVLLFLYAGCASNSNVILLYSGKLDVNLDDKSVILGRVVDKSTNEPLVNAYIIIDSTWLAAKTDNNGNYQISKIPAGTYNIKAAAIGYKNVLFNIKIDKGHRYLIDFFLPESYIGPLKNEKSNISL